MTSASRISTAPSPRRSGSTPPDAPTWPPWPAITADALRVVHEPAELRSGPGPRIPAPDAARAVRSALRGVADDAWDPPSWLLAHQRDAARRIAGSLAAFSGALLADAVGLGKTHVALAVAGRYARVTFLIPAALRGQWTTEAQRRGVTGTIVTHEALSRGAAVPPADLLLVDEAHRFRNPATRRYDRLARHVRGAHVLLLTATPVVNRAADLVHLLRLFLADHALAPFGVRSLTTAEQGPPDTLLHAVLPLVVARSADAARVADCLPTARTAAVTCLSPLPPEVLVAVVAALRALRFPPLGREGRALLYHHLLLRLSSSGEALAASLQRHRRYLDRALEAARRGESFDRGTLRRLMLDASDDQLTLLLEAPAADPPAAAAFEAERCRIEKALALLRRAGPDPKRDGLLAELERRRGRKTIVFTAARATAVSIARSLGWRHVGVASASGGHIASGRLPLDELLARFAPEAQHGGAVPAAMRLDVLVATDLAAEGLNLQDADAVVHYDLPWNPFRMSQRLGRIARLGSRHAEVHVSWYRPPDLLERPLRLLATIRRKAALQLALPVAVTGTVGRAVIASARLERREALALDVPYVARGHTVVDGDGACCVICWEGASGRVREVVGLGGPVAATDLELLRAPASDAPLSRSCLALIGRMLTGRARLAATTPSHAAGRVLGRRILAMARTAGARRDRRLLAALDAALTRLRAGVAVGAERELGDLLANPSAGALDRWTARHPVRHPSLRGPDLEVLVVGTAGSQTTGPPGTTPGYD
jgi:superfamily II DNA or RNA helicase